MTIIYDLYVIILYRHICARQNHYSCVIILLAQGARTDMKNTAGLLAVDCCINKPCDSYNAIKLNMQLKEISVNTRERTSIILTKYLVFFLLKFILFYFILINSPEEMKKNKYEFKIKLIILI